MKKTFDKAKKNSQPKKKWWLVGKKKYFIWMLPVVPFYSFYIYLCNRRWKNLEWNEKRAVKVLNKLLPKILDWVEEEKTFYYDYSWDWDYTTKHKAPLGHKQWTLKFSYELKKFFLDEYQNPAYTKEKGVDEWGDKYLKFIEK